MTPPSLGAVAIGRNEGERLKACLQSLIPQCDRVVYVDSGSSDESVAYARSIGALVVELDSSVPFTAARARNAGFARLVDGDDPPEFIQFVDGDCRVEADWLRVGAAALAEDPSLGLVTGWRSEIHPEATIYNAMFQVDWQRPAGPIDVCGGDMMVRRRAFREIGGFDPTVIAAEDDEFCLRLGDAGWKLMRLPVTMTWHDAAMKSFGPWWRRTVRNGHGFAQVGDLHPSHFRRERLRVWIYGLLLPVLFLTGLWIGWWLSALVVLLYGLSWLRTAQGLRRQGLSSAMALHQAVFLTISKIPNLFGMMTYYRRRLTGRDMHIIEYK
ncbi:glycosyltransferase [Paracoccus ravus]|uniref:glycosyltransferase n=1 Tax=Paracoccus ravus TaxID=2447760 RepID=UPI00106E6FFE|nr:glycosyltransferase [Paracoccus ravus]